MTEHCTFRFLWHGGQIGVTAIWDLRKVRLIRVATIDL